MHPKQFIKVLFVLLLTAGFTLTALAGPPDPPDKATDVPQTGEVQIDDLDYTPVTDAGQVPYAPNGQGYINEVESNGTPGQANSLGTGGVTALGNIYPNADVDYYSFTANAGDRVYAAVMTSFSANGSFDSQLYLYDVDGVTQLEFDDDDGSMGGFSSSIAGKTLLTTGTYYLRVNHFSATGQLRPYYLHVRVQSGAPTAEVEPNDTPATANILPVNGWVSGSRDPALATEQDWYSFSANAGDTVFLSLDLDPERDSVTWNGRLGLGLFGDAGNQILVVDDASSIGATNPALSEAFFMTVKDAGTYFAFVDSATATTGGPTATYTLSVTVYPAVNEGASCTTYTSTDTPIVIGPGTGLVSSSITVPGNPRIADLDVSIQLDHTIMGDLDAHLRSPQGNDNGLFTDIGAATAGGQAQMNVTFDDEAGVTPLFTVLKGLVVRPEFSYRLAWFDGEDAGGVWTLDLRDDGANANGGNLTSWSITVCEPVPPPVCPPGTTQTTIYTTNFEAGADGFTHSGTADEWELGLPATLATTTTNPVAAFLTCNSGTSCWKTDLDNTYDASSSQNLLSPNIDLTGIEPPIVVSWAQRYQMENTTFDHAYVDYQQAGGATPIRLWEWLNATMTDAPGNPAVNIGASSGWSMFTARADSLAGLNTELLFHLDSETSVNFGGLAVDDVTVTGCELLPPAIDVIPTNLESAQDPDVVITQTLTISNTGGESLSWSIAEEPGVLVGEQVVQPISAPPTGTDGSRGTSSDKNTPLTYTSPADFSEDFADITVLPDWYVQNNSSPLGTTNWFQGNDTVFSAQAGAPTAYIGANFNNTSGVGTISNWLLTPELTLNDGDTFSFWTRTVDVPTFPDRLQVRLSTAGASINVGVGAEDVGDFTTLLLEINPTLTTGGYPNVWTQYTLMLSGIPSGATGRFAFRYYVTNAGPAGANSDYVGIDTVEYVSNAGPGVCSTPADIPWVSTSPVSGTVPGLSSANVNVVFDSTGLSAGTYTGNLCVTSNDPVTSLVPVPVTLTVNQPPVPEPLVCNATPTAFENGIPSDWTVVDNTGGTGIVWTTTADTACNIANLTNGSGEAACADSDAAGSGAPPYNTELVSNAFDLTGYNNVILNVAAYYRDLGVGNDTFGVDVWDGSVWTNELTWDENHQPGDIALDLSAYSELTGIQVRFTFAGDGWDWYAQVDDISLTCANVTNPPVIEVSPDSMSSNQVPDTVITQTLTISNTGEAALDWMIDEDAIPNVLYSTVTLPSTPAGTVTLGEGFSTSGKTGPSVAHTLRTPEGSTTITHSATQNITTGNSVSCNAGGLHTNNSYVRQFTLADFGITDPFDVTEVSFGVEQATGATGTQPVTVNLYTWNPSDPFTFANFTLVGTADAAVPDQTLSVYTVPVTGSIPAGGTLVVEVFTPEGQTAGNSFFIGSNADGQTSPSYLAAADCGITNPTDTAAIGFPNMMIVMNVTGEIVPAAGVCVNPEDVAWASVNPLSGTTAGGSASTVEVTFDSTGLAAGVYTGTLCVGSNDLTNPLVTVPLTLTVDLDADLALTKSAPATANVGDNFTYTLEVTNSGPATALDTTVIDTLPAGVTFVSATAGCTEAAGVVTCDLGDLASGGTATIEIVVTADEAGTVSNTAEVSSTSPDPDTTNNSDSADTDVVQQGFMIYLPIVSND